jgi:outer membrane lipoprotein-sorting protein
MLPVLFILVALSSPVSDPVTAALENFQHLQSYQVTLQSNTKGQSEIIRYSYKKPGFVRMEFVKPYRGTVLVYNPEKKKVRLRPFRFLKPLVLTLEPDNRFLISSKGHRVDASDIGVLLKMVKDLQQHGTTKKSGSETIGGKESIRISVEGNNSFTVNFINRYVLWLDTETLFPLKVRAYNLEGELIEEVLMGDLEINIEFPDDFFDL